MEPFVSIKGRVRVNSALLMLSFAWFLFSPDALAQSGMVGSMGGTFIAAPNGMASYSIPIEVVPGTHGMQPRLTVSYNSLGGRGLLGSCWTLTGLSSIVRTPRTLYYDGDMGSINFDANDRYALDGERLVRLSSSSVYAATDAVYGKEAEDFTRVTLRGVPDTISQYFTAVTADGTILEYGNTSNSKQILGQKVIGWWVNRITDPDGNYMDFQYTSSDGEIVPEWIKYTGNPLTNTSTYAKVLFEYITDPNPNRVWVGGKPMGVSKLMSAIKVYYNNSLVRQYQFVYSFDRSTRLTAVVLKDENGNELTRNGISWGADGTAASFQTLPNMSNYNLIPGYFDDDNLIDLFLYTYDSGTQTTSWLVKSGNSTGQFTSTNCSGTIGGYIAPGVFFAADFDGDSKDEIGYILENAPQDSCSFKELSFTGSNYTVSTLAVNATSEFHAGDFLGNGTVQLAKVGKASGSIKTVTCVGNGVSFSVPKDSRLSVTDLNGNGKSDIQVVNGHDIWVYEYDAQTGTFANILNENAYMSNISTKDYHGDFNGDGYMDYIFYSMQGFFLRISKGNDYVVSEALPLRGHHGNDSIPDYPLIIGDVNGDGKDDIIQLFFNFNTQKLTLETYLSRGLNGISYLYDTLQVQNDGVFHDFEPMYHFSELYGNGKLDLLYSGSIYEDPVIINFPERRGHDLAAAFTDGFGKTTALQYSYFNSPSVGQLGREGRHVRWPLVSRLMEPDGIGGTAVTFFSYYDAQFDRQRRQMLGFGHHHAYRNGTNTNEKFYHDSDRHRLALEQSITYYLERDPESMGGYIVDPDFWHPEREFLFHYELYNTPASLDLDYGRFVPYDSVSSTVNRLENTKALTNVWLNQSGRVQKTSTQYSKAKPENSQQPPWVELDSTTFSYVTVTLPNGQQVKRPSVEKTWHRRNGYSQAPYRKTARTYSSGKLSSVKESDSNGTIDSVSYTYNGFGWPVSETHTPKGLASMTKTYAYDSKGRFRTQETNALGHTQSAQYNSRTGWVTSRTDANSLTTSYQYDALGRITQVTRPDGTIRHTSYEWDVNGTFGDAVWRVRETETGLPETRSWYDILGREVHGFKEGMGYTDAVYDSLGHVAKITLIPYASLPFPDSSKQWHTMAYDRFGRVTGESDTLTDISYEYFDFTEAAQHDNFVTVTDHRHGTSVTRTYDAMGRLAGTVDAGGSISYGYDYLTQSGKILDRMTVTACGATTTVLSDIRGNRLSIQDPDAGTVGSTYDVLNRLTSRTDANGNRTDFTYDALGRVTGAVISNGNASETMGYTYDNASGKGVGKIASVTHNGDNEFTFAYDNKGRVSQKVVYDRGTGYTHQYAYDTLGRLQVLTYPSGFQLRHTYNAYGELESLTDNGTDSLVYSIDNRDVFRHPLSCRYGNGTGVQYAYDSFGRLTGIRNGIVTLSNNADAGSPSPSPGLNYVVGSEYRNLVYGYDTCALIVTREDLTTQQSETYLYDNLDRLVSYRVNGAVAASIAYDSTGNITANTRVGSYGYGNAVPHAVTGINAVSGSSIPSCSHSVGYGLRNKPVSILQDDYSISIDYTADGMRKHTRFYLFNTLLKTVTKFSSLHEVETMGNVTRRMDYIYADGRAVAVHVKNGTADSLYYVLTDHLGSWEKVLDQNRNTVQQTHFDPWGNRMSFTAWNTPQTQTSFTFSRGFTGHEHYDRFKIVNANARLYDPSNGRFFSPDPFVQVPDFTQAYNRYSYCMNNPVMFSDPDGEFLGIPMLGLAFIGRSIVNLIDGVENPFGSAWQQAINLVSDMDQCLQFSVSLGENTYLSFGISPFSLGVNAGISYTNGTSSFSIGGGYGVLSGSYGYISGSQTIGDATVSAGFGGGSNYYGWNLAYTFKGYGVGYGRTYYGNASGPGEIPNPQMTGTPSIYFPNGSFRLENDYFGDAHDRWRTNAWELSIDNFTLGSSIYTNNPEELGYGTSNRPSPLWEYNRPDKHDPTIKYEAWNNGYVYSCPLWIGWRHGNSISRVDYSHPIFQDATQNFVHKYCDFGRMHYYLDYDHFESGHFLGGGYYNPFSLY